MTNQTPSAGKRETNAKWGEEFDKKFYHEADEYFTCNQSTGNKDLPCNCQLTDIKSFFTETLLERERELYKSMESLKNDYPDIDKSDSWCEALSKAQSLLREK